MEPKILYSLLKISSLVLSSARWMKFMLSNYELLEILGFHCREVEVFTSEMLRSVGW
jgi:hypothetical protein